MAAGEEGESEPGVVIWHRYDFQPFFVCAGTAAGRSAVPGWIPCGLVGLGDVESGVVRARKAAKSLKPARRICETVNFKSQKGPKILRGKKDMGIERKRKRSGWVNGLYTVPMMNATLDAPFFSGSESALPSSVLTS